VNVYIVVEGNSSEPAVYRSWIREANPALTEANYLAQVTQNNFFMVSGGGWPFLLTIIDRAIADIKATGLFDRLVVGVDSEDMTLANRFSAIEQHILSQAPSCEYRIIVQHFCLEAWALGNRKFIPRKPNNDALKSYKAIHDVTSLDPELLPPLQEEELNRAQFALKYLRLGIRDKGKHLSYSKNRPDVVAHPTYFHQLKERLASTGHIASFQAFVDAFN
jgi:hypothetical protein